MKKKDGILSVTIERSFRNRDFAYLHELFARFGCGIATRDSQETLFDIACRTDGRGWLSSPMGGDAEFDQFFEKISKGADKNSPSVMGSARLGAAVPLFLMKNGFSPVSEKSDMLVELIKWSQDQEYAVPYISELLDMFPELGVSMNPSMGSPSAISFCQGQKRVLRLLLDKGVPLVFGSEKRLSLNSWWSKKVETRDDEDMGDFAVRVAGLVDASVREKTDFAEMMFDARHHRVGMKMVLDVGKDTETRLTSSFGENVRLIDSALYRTVRSSDFDGVRLLMENGADIFFAGESSSSNPLEFLRFKDCGEFSCVLLDTLPQEILFSCPQSKSLTKGEPLIDFLDESLSSHRGEQVEAARSKIHAMRLKKSMSKDGFRNTAQF